MRALLLLALLMSALAFAQESSSLPSTITTRPVGEVDGCKLYRLQENGKWSDQLLVICPMGRTATLGSYKP